MNAMEDVAYGRTSCYHSLIDIDSNVVEIGIADAAKQASVVNVTKNRHLRALTDCHRMVVANLHDTKIEQIDNCPILYALRMTTNSGLRYLTLPSAREVFVSDARDLISMECPEAVKARVMNVDDLQYIHMPVVNSLSLVNVSFHTNNPLEIFHTFPRVESLELANVSGFTFCQMDSHPTDAAMIIRDCSDITTIGDLSHFKEIVISNCPDLRFVERVDMVGRLSIINCPKLERVEFVRGCTSMLINGCDALYHVGNVIAHEVTIMHCWDLQSIPELTAHTLTVERCPMLSGIEIDPRMQYLNISYCALLEELGFQDQTAFQHILLSIRLIGDNQIATIEDWVAHRITVIDNISLERILNVHRLVFLELINCDELETIRGVNVGEEIRVDQCSMLESITDINEVTRLSVSNCISLATVSFVDTRLRAFEVAGCPLLSASFNGEFIEELHLMDCELMFIDDIPESANVNIMDVRLLPNMRTSDGMDDEDVVMDDQSVQENASKLVSRMKAVLDAGRTIAEWLQQKFKNIKIKRFMERTVLDDIYHCVICHDGIHPVESVTTACDHVFHSTCLSQWTSHKQTCPLCNANTSTSLIFHH